MLKMIRTMNANKNTVRCKKQKDIKNVFGGRHEVRNRYQEEEKRRDVKIQLGKFERSEKKE
jgi:hypothetical protein